MFDTSRVNVFLYLEPRRYRTMTPAGMMKNSGMSGRRTGKFLTRHAKMGFVRTVEIGIAVPDSNPYFNSKQPMDRKILGCLGRVGSSTHDSAGLVFRLCKFGVYAHWPLDPATCDNVILSRVILPPQNCSRTIRTYHLTVYHLRLLVDSLPVARVTAIVT